RSHWSVYLRFIPTILMIGIFALIVFCLARPQKTTQNLERTSEGIDILILLDISESMKLQDFKPDRLEAAKMVAKEFVSGRIQDRIGLVVFAGEAFSLSPLTNDYELLNKFIGDIQFEMIPKSGTAIGLALGLGINRLMESTAKSKIMILLSDGDNTAGNIDPFTAAKLASGYRMKIYTIGVGKDGPVLVGTDPFGNDQYIENNMDETTLRTIAKIGGGNYYRASNNSGLKSIMETIDRLEKSEYKERKFKNTSDFYQVYLNWAIFLFLIWLLLKSTFIANPVED
ncbi:MAG TPA: VWA domain-containing protein, partial [Catalimonadaceae bacterium]|nr:VWA domain-containing protein [Catalimonadaceae bacterium]